MTLARRIAALGLMLSLGCAGSPGLRDGLTSGAAAGDGPSPAEEAGRVFVYVGTAGGEVALFYLDVVSGALARRGTVSVGRAPSSLARSAARESLLVVDGATGQAASFSIDAKTGTLRPAGRAATGGGTPPAGATLDDTGKYLLAAHPTAGRVSVLAITEAAGLKPIDSFAAGAGAHAVAVHPAQIAFVSNFRADSLSQYTFNIGTGMLTNWSGPAIALPPGSRPTRLVCHPSGRWVYLLEEGTDSIAVYGFDTDLKALSPISSQTVSTLPDGFARDRARPADLTVSPNGRFLYETNRGSDDVAAFAISGSGTLQPVGRAPAGGRGPGALAVDPNGRVLIVANEGGKSLSVYSIDPTTGALGPRRLTALPAAPLAVLAVRP